MGNGITAISIFAPNIVFQARMLLCQISRQSSLAWSMLGAAALILRLCDIMVSGCHFTPTYQWMIVWRLSKMSRTFILRRPLLKDAWEGARAPRLVSYTWLHAKAISGRGVCTGHPWSACCAKESAGIGLPVPIS